MTGRPNNLEQDIRRCPDLIKLMADDAFCVQLWTACGNITWYKKFDPLDSNAEQISAILIDDQSNSWGASFRSVAGMIAEIRNEFHGADEDYMTWYCCNYEKPCGYVSEAVATALNAIGWFPIKDQYYKAANAR